MDDIDWNDYVKVVRQGSQLEDGEGKRYELPRWFTIEDGQEANIHRAFLRPVE
jgi:hypothetical protein